MPQAQESKKRGVGSISYVVKPKAGLPSGTVIQNQAQIVFDFNDPIDTPLVKNSLDAAAPTNQVAPLPATRIQTFQEGAMQVLDMKITIRYLNPRENEGRRIVINNGRTQGETRSAVGICALRERVGRHGQVHQQELEVGA